MDCRKLLSARQVLFVIIKGEYQVMVKKVSLHAAASNPLMPWQVKNDNFDNDDYYQ